MATITNNEIKFIKSLSAKKARESSGMFVVEGEKMVSEALESGLEVVRVLRVEDIGQNTMSRITNLSEPSPCLAVVRIPHYEMPDVGKGLYLGLDSVRDPGNLGTIIRLSDWFGVDAIFASRDCVDAFNSKTIQSTMGAIFRKKVIYCDLADVIYRFGEAGKKIWGTFMDGRDIYRETSLSPDGLVIMGNESRGISESIEALVTDRLTIPSFSSSDGGNGSESLNVAMATAITLSEFRRRF